MDSGRGRDKSRGKCRRRRRRRTLSEFKFDSFGLNFEPPTIRIEEYHSPSDLSVKKRFSPLPEGDLKHWTVLTEGFPPGVTVDELKKYGRRRQPAHMIPQDNLRLEEGSLKPYKSEYAREFQAYGPLERKPIPDKTTANKENSGNHDVGYYLPRNASTCKMEPEKRPLLKRPPVTLEPMKTDNSADANSLCLTRPCRDKRKLLRRSTALRPEGMMTNETEVRKEYRAYPNPERAHMIRRLPSLKVEGDFEPFTTEQQDKYVAYLLGKRPVLEKKKTILKMEGDFNFLTENNLSYVPHELPERPRLRKRSTSLKLDGELEFFPEYRESFVDYSRTRPITYKPYGSLRSDGELEKQTEMKRQYVSYDNLQVPASAKPENNLHVEGEMEGVPEYRYNYVDFPRERPHVRKPLNQIKLEGDLQVLSEGSGRLETESALDQQEKANNQISNNNSNNNNLTPCGMSNFISEQNDKFRKHDSPAKTELIKMAPNLKLEGEMNFVTEKADKFGIVTPCEGQEPGKRPSSLKLENDIFLQPAYRSVNNTGPLKPVRNSRSNPPSLREKPIERIKFNFDEDKKFIFGTPSRRYASSNSRRINESSRPTEKTLKFHPSLSPSRSKETVQGKREMEIGLPEITKYTASNSDKLGDAASPGKFGVRSCPIVPGKRNQAFHVLDVKGQLGCQSMRRDILNSSSEEDDSIYRLEVSNPEMKPPLPGRDLKLFPPPTTANADVREEAERRARKRAEGYEKIVKSPEVANYLIGGENNNDAENDWKAPGKLSPMLAKDNNNNNDNNRNEPAFVILEGRQRQTKDKREKNDFDPVSAWMNSSPYA